MSLGARAEASFKSHEANNDWGDMAALLVMTVPTAVIFSSTQHSIVGGLTAGATKG